MIQDYYGSTLEPEPVMSSVGPVVDIAHHTPGETFGHYRLLPTEAVELARQILEAARGPEDPPIEEMVLYPRGR